MVSVGCTICAPPSQWKPPSSQRKDWLLFSALETLRWVFLFRGRLPIAASYTIQQQKLRQYDAILKHITLQWKNRHFLASWSCKDAASEGETPSYLLFNITQLHTELGTDVTFYLCSGTHTKLWKRAAHVYCSVLFVHVQWGSTSPSPSSGCCLLAEEAEIHFACGKYGDEGCRESS